MRVVSLTPRQLRATFARWSTAGATQIVVGGRFRALRSAIGWAYDERIIDHPPKRRLGSAHQELNELVSEGAGVVAQLAWIGAREQ